MVASHHGESDHSTRIKGSIAIVGAGDHIGAAIARKFASEGYVVHAARRSADKLASLQHEIEAAGGRCVVESLDARHEQQVKDFFARADHILPLRVCVFNAGGFVHCPLLETTEQIFREMWEINCYAGFLAGREAARRMAPHGHGSIFFTGATASMRGAAGYSAFASAKFGLRAVAQAMARELGPKHIHVAHLVIDAVVDTAVVRERRRQALGRQDDASAAPGMLAEPESIANAYWMLHHQTPDAWTFELDLRPHKERW
ncbi:MAG TPA: SDR family NAD(P)-dependent oxidoreductase [Chthoniobacterales bacterium]